MLRRTRSQLRLPYDLLRSILDFCAGDTLVLAALARTSRVLHALASPLLYRSVDISDARRLKQLFYSVSSSS